MLLERYICSLKICRIRELYHNCQLKRRRFLIIHDVKSIFMRVFKSTCPPASLSYGSHNSGASIVELCMLIEKHDKVHKTSSMLAIKGEIRQLFITYTSLYFLSHT